MTVDLTKLPSGLTVITDRMPPLDTAALGGGAGGGGGTGAAISRTGTWPPSDRSISPTVGSPGWACLAESRM